MNGWFNASQSDCFKWKDNRGPFIGQSDSE